MVDSELYKDLIGREFEYHGRGPHKYDCLGLSIEIWKRLGKVFPDYSSFDELQRIHSEIVHNKPEWTKLEKPIPYSIVLLKIIPPFVTHLGVVLEDCVRFIHIMPKKSVVVERLDSVIWKKRVEGFYWRS